tara:strand:+ start:735 stop:1133 length:399 start_codon:yes stop_codon:yes gene_type:complete
MANSRRVEKVASLIRKEISQLLLYGVRDERVHRGLITITQVELSADLQCCKIYVSVLGDQDDKKEVFLGLEAITGFLKGELGRRIKMRRAPELVFKLDKGMEKGSSVLNLLGELERERKKSHLNNQKTFEDP